MEKFGEGLCALLLLLYFAHVVKCDSRCIAQFGTCKYTSSGCPGGSFTKWLCNGPYDRQCCVPDYTYADRNCRGRGGTCQRSSTSCAGSYVVGLCGGPSDRRCCVPTSGGSGSGGTTGAGSCSGVTIVSRDQWGARRPKSTSRMTTPVSRVFIHHTVTGTCSGLTSCASVLRQIQYNHMYTRKPELFSDIGYNFLVGSDGTVYEGRGWDRDGAHTKGFNSKSIAISFIGNFMNQSPTTSALNAAQNLIACGVSKGKITSSYRLYGHRQSPYSNTECPGDRLYNIIQGWPHYTSGTAT